MKFTESHEWIEHNSATNTATVGVTDYAQHELGEIVYVELPTVGKDVKAGGEAAVLESTKAAADVYAPVSGTIVEINSRLSASSELVNQSPENEGWLFKIKLSNPSELSKLMDLEAYRSMTKGK